MSLADRLERRANEPIVAPYKYGADNHSVAAVAAHEARTKAFREAAEMTRRYFKRHGLED